jgi:hypothetical protein
MDTKRHGPSWWLLYLLIPMMFAAFGIEIHLPLSVAWHRGMEFCIVLLMYVLISLWLKANTGAILIEDYEGWQATSKHSLPSSTPDSDPHGF